MYIPLKYTFIISVLCYRLIIEDTFKIKDLNTMGGNNEKIL